MSGDGTFSASLGRTIGLIARRWRHLIDLRLQPYALTDATWVPLLELERMKRPLRQKELATALTLDGSSIVRLLDSLEKAGLVERVTEQGDRRARSVTITREGQQRVREIQGISTRLEKSLLAGVSPEDIAITRRVLAHIVARLDDSFENS